MGDNKTALCQCGKPMTKNAKTCRACFSQKGERNYNYKGGISTQFYRYKCIQKERYPERVRAREIVSKALKSGKLVKAPCIFCGSNNVQAHHDDYSKPLDVKWMCRRDHRYYESGLLIQVQITAPTTAMVEAA
jgi:hypothetical protein